MAKFKKGAAKPANSGRRPGVQNHVTLEIRELARSMLDAEYFERLRARLLDGKCPPQIETLLLHYGWGRPSFRIEGDISDPTMDIATARLIAERGRAIIAAEKRRAKK